ncbi:DUF1971 domain-containing protein [Altererythrobacter sp. Root672]|uniref:DUF1971 domain-containing protein n=1 Tax=Altererythrobacter sp. Root672 TaxID=1736584 RepID=UPI001F344258|nr:DUF1971 domain-containing protein [Altererythrobacter sp. Root672]
MRKLFERYEGSFNRALSGVVDLEEVVSLYAPEFIGAAPGGVMTGKNDDKFALAMAEGYARYRTIGMKDMHLREVRISPIDDLHCLAHVGWTATYARWDQPDVAIDFEVQYFVRTLEGEPKVFGWVTGDEETLLREHGILGPPDGLRTYKRTATYTEDSIPAGLLKDHATKEGTWGLIHVEQGKLRFLVTDDRRPLIERILTPETDPGLVEPTILHHVEPLGQVRFHVEFLQRDEMPSPI